MEKILEQIDGIIGDAFHLPKSDATDKLLADLEDLRNMVASQQSVHRTPEQLDRLHENLDEIIEVGAGGE